MGVGLILYGLFMKMVIADNLGVFVDSVYGDIAGASSLKFYSSGLSFTLFQIYCDFSWVYNDCNRFRKNYLMSTSLKILETPYLSTFYH